MKKLLLLFSLSLFFFSCNNVKKDTTDEIAKLKKQHQEFLKNSPFKKTLAMTREERKQLGLPPNPYLERQWELTMNPRTGRPTPEKLHALERQLYALENQSRGVPGTTDAWEERGPVNVGGRTKALLFDPNDPTGKRVFAGSVSGGLWYNDDITNQYSVWHLTNMPQNMAVSSITVDPNNSQIFYVGTGESYTSGAVNGNGIWKSTDGGYTWQHVFGGQNGDATFVTDANLNISSPASLQGDLHAVKAAFGPTLTSFSGDLVLTNDGSANPLQACSALTNAAQVNGKIAVIMRGDCFFVDKVMNAQNAGAIGVLMINNVSGTPIIMGGTNSSITIPSVMISNADGQAILTALNNSQNVHVTISATGADIALGYIVPGVTHINDIIARDNNGTTEIFAAAGDAYYADASAFTLMGQGYQGLYKSTDNGATWNQVTLPQTPNNKNYIPFDLALGADNSVWLSTTQSYNFDHDYGAIFNSTDGNTFNVKFSMSGMGRINITTSKQDANKVYAVAVSTSNGKPVIFSTTDAFTNMNIITNPVGDFGPADDFTNGQSFYDLAIAVDPNDDQTLYIGGIDWFKSTNGGSNWTQITSGYGNSGSHIHPDQHGIAFGDSNKIVIGNDGGVAYSSNAGGSFFASEAGYVTAQFYSVAAGPVAAFGQEYFMAGAQDNGSQLFVNAQPGYNASVTAQGGDGAYCFFDQDGTDKYRISNYVYNGNIKLYDYQNNTPRTINTESAANGDFINQETLDSHLNILYTNYSVRSQNGSTYRLRRYKNLLGSIQKTIIQDPLMNSFPTALEVSPYTTSSSKLYVGLQTGKLLRVDHADTNPTFTDIGSTNFVGSISDIEFGANEDTIFVTFFNYGVKSIYYTEDGGTTWVSKEGNLPDMPVNCILQNPLRPQEVIIGTDLGIWKTEDFTATNPVWVHSNNGMNTVKVTDMDMRDDHKVYVATYGRGIFTGMFTTTDGIDDVTYSNNITVYPNPVQDNLNIKMTDDNKLDLIDIYDINGKKVMHQFINANNTIDVSRLSSGNYILHAQSGKTIYTTKFIKR